MLGSEYRLYGYEIQGHCQIIDESVYIVFEHFLLSRHQILTLIRSKFSTE